MRAPWKTPRHDSRFPSDVEKLQKKKKGHAVNTVDGKNPTPPLMKPYMKNRILYVLFSTGEGFLSSIVLS